MDSEESRARYEVEIGQKGERLFKHLFPYASVTFLNAQNADCIRMSVSIPADMQKSFEDAFRRKFTGAICQKIPAAA